jgi:hypothetical protein
MGINKYKVAQLVTLKKPFSQVVIGISIGIPCKFNTIGSVPIADVFML